MTPNRNSLANEPDIYDAVLEACALIVVSVVCVLLVLLVML